MTLHVSQSSGVAIIMPEGMLLDGSATDAFDKEIRRLLRSEPKAILLDLGRTECLSSRVFGIIHLANTLAKKQGITFGLCNVNVRIGLSLEALKLKDALEIYETREDFLFGTGLGQLDSGLSE